MQLVAAAGRVQTAAAMRVRVALALALVGISAAMPIDAVHKYMEPPPDRTKRPHLQNPLPRRLRSGSGTGSVILRLATPQRSLALIPAAAMGICLFSPQLMTRLVLHIIFCIGSLLEPFDTTLPKKSVLRSFIRLMQDARRAYEEKHGLVQMGEQQFFDDIDSAATDEAPPSEADEAADEAEAAEGENDANDDDMATDGED